MDIRILYGTSRRENTRACIHEMNACLSENPGGFVIMMVPEQFSALYEDKLIAESTEKGLFHTQVLTFKRLTHMIFNQTLTLRDNPVDNAGKSMMIHELISGMDELVVFKKSKAFPGFSSEVSKLIREFKRYGVKPKALAEISAASSDPLFSRKMAEISGIFSAYNEKIGEQGFCDADDDLFVLAEIIGGTRFFDDASVWFDAFDGFTPQEMAVITRIAEKARQTTFSLCMEKPGVLDPSDVFYPVAKTGEELKEKCKGPVRVQHVPGKDPCSDEIRFLRENVYTYHKATYGEKSGDIQVFKAFDIYEEAKQCAAGIDWMVREQDLRYKDICVVASSYEEYRYHLETQFRKYNIPYFMDERRPITRHPLIAYLLSLLDVCIDQFAYEPVFAVLKSPYSRMDPEDVFHLENYVLKWGIRGIGTWTSPWTYKDDDSPEQEALLEKANGLRKAFTDSVIPFFERIKNGVTARDFFTAFHAFLLSDGVYEKLLERVRAAGDEADRQEQKQSWNILMKVFDQVHTVSPGKKTTQKFKDMLLIAFSEYSIGVTPPAVDRVPVGSIGRTRAMDAKILFILGASEPFPSEGLIGEGILTDKDRGILEKHNISVAEDSKAHAMTSQLHVTNALSIPTDKLFISYASSASDEKTGKPSHFVQRVKSLFPGSKEMTRDDFPDHYYYTSPLSGLEAICAERQLGKWYEEHGGFHVPPVESEERESGLGTYGAKLLYGDTLHTSVSKLEKYGQCPFSYYAQYGLDLMEREIFGLKATHMGEILHQLVQELSQEIKDYGAVTYEDCISAGSRLYEAIYQLSHTLQRNKRLAYMGKRLLKRAAYAFYATVEQIRGGAFQPALFEEKLPLLAVTSASGKSIVLGGRVDRVDIAKGENEYFRVIDYKSTVSPLRLYRVQEGLDLQLPVYLYAMAKAGLAKPAGMYHFQLDKPLVRVTSVKNRFEYDDERLKMMRLSGYTLNDPEVLSMTDREEKGGIIQERKLLDQDVLEKVFAHVEHTIQNTCEDIFNGVNRAKPSFDAHPACLHCPYKGVCGFNEEKPGCQYRYIHPKKDDELTWNTGRTRNT
ncbi:MAG: PD-(D/E)XK nuclease family protein [Clostridia bacterium]